MDATRRRFNAALTLIALFALLGATCVSSTTSHSVSPPGDYCQYETVRASCAENEVVLIRRAIYGRMKLGRCVKSDFGFVGCFVDVMDVLDRLCSGRRSCEILVTDPVFDSRKPCNDEFKNYLEIDYICVRTAASRSVSCSIDLAAYNGATVYLTKDVVNDASCGSSARPWKVTAPAGQRINITLLDFSLYPSLGGSGSGSNVASSTSLQRAGGMTICYKYGHVRESAVGTHRGKDICGSQQRSSLVHETKTSSAEIVLADNEAFSFLLLISAIGCSNPILSSELKWIRTDDVIEARCNDRSPVWRLHCNDNQWIGYISNCSTGDQHANAVSNQRTNGDVVFLAADLTVGIIIGVAITISTIIIAIGLIVIRRRRCSNRGGQSSFHDSSYYRSTPHHSDNCPMTEDRCYTQPSLLHGHENCGDGEFTYTDRSVHESPMPTGLCSPDKCHYMRVHSATRADTDFPTPFGCGTIRIETCSTNSSGRKCCGEPLYSCRLQTFPTIGSQDAKVVDKQQKAMFPLQ